MIIDSETKRKLREMNAAELLDAFERLDERTVMPLNHAEVVGLAVDNAYGGYTDAKIQRLVKRAGLRYPQANAVYGQINVYGVTTKSERHKRSYWTRTADGNGIGGRKAPVPYGS